MGKDSTTRLFDQYEELSTNVTDNDFTLASEFLTDIGLDVNQIAQEGLEESKRLVFLSQAQLNESNDESLIDRAAERLTALIKKNSEVVGQLLLNSLSSKQASFQFRNLEKWSEDQMRDVLNDLDLVKLLEDLEDLDQE